VKDAEPVRTLFVNSGILGLKTFASFVERVFVGHAPGIQARQTVLTEGLTLDERLIRRLVCTRLWPDGLAGLRNVDLLRFRAEWHSGVCAARRLHRLEAAGPRFDVLHFHRQAAAYASLDGMRRTPSIVSIDCTQRCVLDAAATPVERRTYAPNVRRDGEVFRAARLIIATSEWAAACIRREYPDCTTDVVVQPNPVMLEAFDAGWVERRHEAARDPGYQPRVLFMGGDFPRKGGYELLRAWRNSALHQHASLDLVTGWPLRPSELPPRVTVHPRVDAHSDAWKALWRDADIFVLPTRDEAFGLVYQEAGAAGLPAIGTTINAVPEIIRDGVSGILVSPGDDTALVQALTRLIASPDLRREMGSAARSHIERTADSSRYRDELAAAIHRLASRRSR